MAFCSVARLPRSPRQRRPLRWLEPLPPVAEHRISRQGPKQPENCRKKGVSGANITAGRMITALGNAVCTAASPSPNVLGRGRGSLANAGPRGLPSIEDPKSEIGSRQLGCVLINAQLASAAFSRSPLEHAHNCGVFLLALGDCSGEKEMIEFLTHMPPTR